MIQLPLLGNDVLELIPQRPPFVMIDALHQVSETSAQTGLTISSTNFLFEDGHFQEAGLIEHIAQSAAAMTGFQCKSTGVAVKKGFIGSIKNLNIIRLPKEGETLQTTIEMVNQVMEFSIIQGTVKIDNELIAECEMRIFIEN